MCTLKAIHPKDGAKIEKGTIYVAPPDHHLLIDKLHVAVKKGPKENRFRPSVDALFRSAAYEYGLRVIGIILSGYLDDGTAGMFAVKSRGGIAIIQNPEEAEFPDMPRNVQEVVKVDYIVSVSEIVPLLVVLTGKDTKEEPEITDKVALLGINGITLS